MDPKETNASSAPPETGREEEGRCPGGCCGRCCRGGRCGGCRPVEYVVIDSFVWPPYPEKNEEKP